MERFTALYQRLDQSTRPSDKLAALVTYFRQVRAEEAAWAVHILCGGTVPRLLGRGALRRTLTEQSGLPDWLVEETYAHVGDLAETVALLLADPSPTSAPDAGDLADWIERHLLPLVEASEAERRAQIGRWWRTLSMPQCLVLTKLLTGALRIGVQQSLVLHALAEVGGISRDRLADRFSGGFTPSAAAYRALLDPHAPDVDPHRPYPFFLARPLEGPPEALGDPAAWAAEWKWDGIRAQLIKRDAQTVFWSRGEERLDGRFPELEAAATGLPTGLVLDGEIVAWRDERPLPFAALQRRIQRRRPGAKSCQDVPVVFLAFDLLELDGLDRRTAPYLHRRAMLADVLAANGGVIRPAPRPPGQDWSTWASARAEARTLGVEGLLLKRLDSRYGVGRTGGAWWKWKLDPLTIDAVLVYAQAGHGRRAGLHTDHTFALWHDGALVPVAKAYYGLTDAELSELDRWIRSHTLERFGPVRRVEPYWVFELAFEAVQASKRHKSGVALRFPRIHRWRRDKPAAEADRLDALYALLR